MFGVRDVKVEISNIDESSKENSSGPGDAVAGLVTNNPIPALESKNSRV